MRYVRWHPQCSCIEVAYFQVYRNTVIFEKLYLSELFNLFSYLSELQDSVLEKPYTLPIYP